MAEKNCLSGGYIFDYGGTLDTGGCHWGQMIWHAYCEEHVPVSEDVFREAYVYAERQLGSKPIIMPDYTFRRTLETKLRIEMEHISSENRTFDPRQWLQKTLSNLYAKAEAGTKRSRKTLIKVREHCPMVLVTNFYGNMHTVLREFALDDLFDEVIESATAGVRKPDPRIFTLGVKALGMNAEEVTVVGDSYENDIVPAKKAGCRTVWLRGEGWTNEAPADTSADMIITRLEEITK